MEKARDAFRTISEVSDWLETPPHVLRFWESKFTQVKPVKRAGGRRYYRPSDMMLLGGIKKLLHQDGLTINSVKKLLQTKGIKHVASFAPPLDMPFDAFIDDNVSDKTEADNVVPIKPTDLTPSDTSEPVQNTFFFDDIEDPAPQEPADTHVLAALNATDPAILSAKHEKLETLMSRLVALRDKMAANAAQ
ncbi:MerR family transcriptional regulator [Parasulfitobacter algicola]|uniref:MerR family transcriptional regulator n=1 Tax=Parasulfitobacter algicola TaxID=2614809 RepID=A0ABX2IQL0_9RHOB|nr:MerR family transcriptional regulator [Sulfitobacter algicola]NSX55169.1 MerR family transcriptional regulator [Sulfitobacter algicola]